MSQFCIRFGRDGHRCADVTFCDDDPMRAMFIAQEHREPAQIWKDGQYLLTISRSPGGGFWQLYQEDSCKSGSNGDGSAMPDAAETHHARAA